MPFVLDFVKSEVSLLVQSSTYVGAVLLVFGLACFGSISFLSAIDHALFEALALLRSLAKLGILPLLPDFAKLELPILLHSLVQLGLAASIFGLSCLSLAFLPFDSHSLDPFLFAQSLSRVDLPVLLFGVGQMDSLIPVLDFICLGLSMLLKALSHPDSLVLVSGLV